MGLRIAFTISGAVSLGAYEAGVLAALVAGLQPVCDGDDPPVCVDVLGGASAGSICSLLAAWCLSAGLDPVQVLREAWVEQADMASLRRGAQGAPLNVEALEAIARKVVMPPPGAIGRNRQRRPIRLRMALTPLRGLQYRIRSLESPPGRDDGHDAVTAVTFVDWCDFEIGPDTTVDDLLAASGPVDAALASASNAWAFPPRWLDRRDVAADYVANGITNLPETGGLWFTDGGTVDNEPIGRTLEVVADVDSDLYESDSPDDRRLLVLVHPHPSATSPAEDWAWADAGDEPRWLSGALRALQILTSQSVHDDLRRLEKVNGRLRWLDRFTDAIAPVLDDLDDGDRTAVTTALAGVLDAIDSDRARLHPTREAGAGPKRSASGDATPDVATLLRRIVARIGGLRGKREVLVDVISPRLVDASTPVEGLLGGEILVRFGGFLDHELRLNDFRLGYESSLVWLRSGALERHGVPAAVAATVLAAAEAALAPAERVDLEEFRRIGETRVRDLPVRAKYELARVLAHLSAVILRDLGDE